MRNCIAILFAALLLWSVPVFAQLGVAPGAADNAHTRVLLIADVRSIKPGTQFTTGILMAMDPGWHTYWKNPGEAGLATRIRWTLPDGFVAGPTQWPLPQKHIESGDVLTYGYERETMLLIPITVPADLRANNTVTLKASVQWLECERVCIPGSATAMLTLPVGAGEPSEENVPLFARYAKLVPSPLPSSPEITVTTQARAAKATIHLAVSGDVKFAAQKDTAPDFYPEPLDELSIGRTVVTAGEQEATLVIPLAAYQKVTTSLTLHGTLVYKLEQGETRAFGIDIPLPPEFCANLPVPGEQAPGLLERSFVTTPTGDSQQQLWLYILFAVIGGILLNIMPCVLPVIALKIFGLVKMAGDQPARIKRLGWTFSLGILASFLLLALLVIVLQALGQQVGWGFQFQEPLFVIAMSAVVFAFGLSLFGVFEIQVPSKAVSGVGHVVARQEKEGKGYGSSFAEGVFATILATPCTAPFLGTALGFAFSQPWWVILVIFACVALGMALPYLVLTAKPGWLKYLPKPGDWMTAAKQFMGFLMMATLIWLLYILGKQLGMEAVIWTNAFLLVVAVACWIVGRYATLLVSRAKYWTIWGMAAVLVVAGYWLFIESALNIRAVIAGTPDDPGQAAISGAQGIPWKPFVLTDLESDLKAGKFVFIDFTAEWCLTCKVNEKSVMTDPKVVDRFKALNVTPIRADWTNRNPDITRLLAKFGRSGVPLYVIFPAGKPDAPVVLPEVITTGTVLDALDGAVK